MATPEENQQTTETATSASAEPKDPEENVLAHPDETTDVVLEVEGRELHASRAVLAHYSPVFRAMFFSHFKENSADKVPLPGKQFDTMVTFCNVLYPRSASAKCLINDDNLIELLRLADEYQTDPVKVVCQNYIRQQVCEYFHNFYRISIKSTADAQTTRQFSGLYDIYVKHLGRGDMSGQTLTKQALLQKLVLYMRACDDYGLPVHRDVIKALIVDMAACLTDVSWSIYYPALSLASKVDLLEALCTKFCAQNLEDEKNRIARSAIASVTNFNQPSNNRNRHRRKRW